MKLYCKQYADAGELLIILHGLFGNQGNWGQHAKIFANQYAVYGMDHRNHGRSEWEEGMTYEALAGDVHHTMRLYGIPSAHFIGHSMGGKTAMQLAISYPDLVRKLVVVDIAPVQYKPHHDAIFEGLKTLNLDLIDSRQDADEILSEYVSEKGIRDFLLANLVKDAEGNYDWRMNLDAIRHGYTDLLAGMPDGKFMGPTLFIKGENSDYILKEHEKAIMGRFPNAQIEQLDGTGHWLHAEQPELFQAMVHKFLKN